MKYIQTAIERYYNDKLQYPKTLDELVPMYLNVLPKYSSSKNYFYAYYPAGTPKSYHLGAPLGGRNATDPEAFKSDADFNSERAGLVGGFTGMDPVYDLTGGSIPNITSINPSLIGTGTFNLTIDGVNFDSGAVEQVYNTDGTFMGHGAIKSRTASQIVVVEYMNGVTPGDYTVYVKNSDGQWSNGVTLTITNSTIAPTDKFLTYLNPDPYGDSTRVYWIQNNKRYHVIDSTLIDTMRYSSIAGWSWQGVYTVSNAYTPAPDFISTASESNGMFIRLYGGTDVYKINNGQKEYVSNAVCQQVNCWPDVIDVPQTYLDMFPTSGTTTVISLAMNDWMKLYCGPWENTVDGLKVYGTDYRINNQILSKTIYNFIGKELFIKWKANNGGSFSAFGPGLFGVLDLGDNFSSPSACCQTYTKAIANDTWYYTRIKINPDKTFNHVTSTNNYDINGGSVFVSETKTIPDAQWQFIDKTQIYFRSGDQYAGASSYFVIAEVKTDAIPVTISYGSTVTYDFEDGLIPASFHSTGNWTVTNDGYNSSHSLYINTSQNSSISLDVTDAVAVSFKIRVNIPTYSGIGFTIPGYIALSESGDNFQCWNDLHFIVPGSGIKTLIWNFSNWGGGAGQAWIDDIKIYYAGSARTIHGKVTQNGVGLSGVSLTITDLTSTITTTASDGTYSFTNLADGSYTITPTLNWYAFTPASKPVTVAGTDVTGVDFSAEDSMPPSMQVTTNGSSVQPSWSLDGSRIVYQSTTNGITNIRTININGTDQKQITNMPGILYGINRSAWGPVYQPNSDQIYYIDNSPTGADYHWIAKTSNNGSTGRTPIMKVPGGNTFSAPKFSPDGSRFCYVQYNPYSTTKFSIMIANADGSNPQLIMGNNNINYAWTHSVSWGRGINRV
ncbi:MAG: PD40 domain-containing protein [Nitrospirae bacterium]|nr:PD40 domain-containing protein [Nitrospirota bacterium]